MNDLVSRIANASPVGPSSFDGHEWLVILNLGGSTALCLIALAVVIELTCQLWHNRETEKRGHPVTLFRVIVLCFAAGIMLRKAASAAVLWKWNPADPVGTGHFLTAQRFIDPLADGLQYFALALVIMTSLALQTQLRKRPWPIPVIRRLGELKLPAMVCFASFVAAFGIVVTR